MTFYGESNKGDIIDTTKKILDILNEFCMQEYSTRFECEDIRDLEKVQIIYTEYEDLEELKEFDIDEMLMISVYVDVKNYEIYKEINNVEVYREKYNYNDFMEVLESLDFNAWVSLDKDEIEIYKNKKIKDNK